MGVHHSTEDVKKIQSKYTNNSGKLLNSITLEEIQKLYAFYDNHYEIDNKTLSENSYLYTVFKRYLHVYSIYENGIKNRTVEYDNLHPRMLSAINQPEFYKDFDNQFINFLANNKESLQHAHPNTLMSKLLVLYKIYYYCGSNFIWNLSESTTELDVRLLDAGTCTKPTNLQLISEILITSALGRSIMLSENTNLTNIKTKIYRINSIVDLYFTNLNRFIYVYLNDKKLAYKSYYDFELSTQLINQLKLKDKKYKSEHSTLPGGYILEYNKLLERYKLLKRKTPIEIEVEYEGAMFLRKIDLIDKFEKYDIVESFLIMYDLDTKTIDMVKACTLSILSTFKTHWEFDVDA